MGVAATGKPAAGGAAAILACRSASSSGVSSSSSVIGVGAVGCVAVGSGFVSGGTSF